MSVLSVKYLLMRLIYYSLSLLLTTPFFFIQDVLLAIVLDPTFMFLTSIILSSCVFHFTEILSRFCSLVHNSPECFLIIEFLPFSHMLTSTNKFIFFFRFLIFLVSGNFVNIIVQNVCKFAGQPNSF